ncbi:MAG: MalT-like region [Acidobacteriota bacterium]|nr:MalT-like region [Acidobacteriota bacterium]
MVEEHPTPHELREFAEGELPKDRARIVVSHFIQGCTTCRTEAAALLNLVRIRRGPRATSPELLRAYDQAFDRALETLQAGRLLNPASTATAATADTADPAWLQALAGVPAGLRGAELVEALLERAWSLRHDKPVEMLRIARLAVLTAGAFNPEISGGPRVADLQCAAWACLGNASRITGDLTQAQEALDHAAALLAKGSGDPLLRARLYDFQASLESVRGQYDRALVALDVVVSIHRDRGDQHMEGRALISKGLQAGYAGRPRQALRLTREGLALLDEDLEPDLVLTALHNQLWFQVEAGRPREARRFLARHRDRLAAGETQRLDLLWLEGRIESAVGRLNDGQSLLDSAYQAFEAAGFANKAANVTIDLAALAIRQGQPTKARALIRSAEDAFRDLGAPKSTLVALSFLHRRLVEREVPVHLVLRLADLVRRTQAEAGQGLEVG